MNKIDSKWEGHKFSDISMNKKVNEKERWRQPYKCQRTGEGTEGEVEYRAQCIMWAHLLGFIGQRRSYDISGISRPELSPLQLHWSQWEKNRFLSM